MEARCWLGSCKICLQQQQQQQITDSSSLNAQIGLMLTLGGKRAGERTECLQQPSPPLCCAHAVTAADISDPCRPHRQLSPTASSRQDTCVCAVLLVLLLQCSEVLVQHSSWASGRHAGSCCSRGWRWSRTQRSCCRFNRCVDIKHLCILCVSLYDMCWYCWGGWQAMLLPALLSCGDGNCSLPSVCTTTLVERLRCVLCTCTGAGVS